MDLKWPQNDCTVMIIFQKRNMKEEEEMLRQQWQIWLATNKKRKFICSTQILVINKRCKVLRLTHTALKFKKLSVNVH